MPNFKKWFRRTKDSGLPSKGPYYQDPNSPPCLPSQRPRALTLPLPATPPSTASTAIKQWTSPQSESAFMCLPVEIRLRIYEAAFGDQKIHLAFNFDSRVYQGKSQPKEWRWWRCVCSWDQDQPWWHDNCCRVNSDSGKGSLQNGMMGKRKVDMALLLTCRKVYSEGIQILYSTTTFQFAAHDLLRHFSQYILPQRFMGITSIELMWDIYPADDPTSGPKGKASYDALWTMLAAMPNLRKLRVAVHALPCPNTAPASLQEVWLKPLEQFRGKGLETFEYVVPSSYAKHFQVNEADAGFELRELHDIITEVSCFGSSGI